LGVKQKNLGRGGYGVRKKAATKQACWSQTRVHHDTVTDVKARKIVDLESKPNLPEHSMIHHFESYAWTSTRSPYINAKGKATLQHIPRGAIVVFKD